jgi:hypothetical protein
MLSIQNGWYPIYEIEWSVDDVADRYQVHRDTVYKGVRADSPLFPKATRKGTGPKAWLYFTPEDIRQCDQSRIAFYQTTPSWQVLLGQDAGAAPPRRSAREVVKAATRKVAKKTAKRSGTGSTRGAPKET